MKKIVISLILAISFSSIGMAQDYEQYLRQGKDFFDRGEYLPALEQFDLAYEIADTDSTESDAKIWKDNCREKIKQNLAELNSSIKKAEAELNLSKKNAESVLKIVLTASNTWTSSGKKLYDLAKIRGTTIFSKGAFYDALNYFKFAKMSPDYVADNEVESYIAKCTDSLKSMKKIALIIGNANYVENNLEKVITDAQDFEKALKSIGFEVTSVFNLKTGEFDKAIKEFYMASEGYDIALLFYSGFAYNSDYLLPVDTKSDAEGNLKSWFSLNYLMNEYPKTNTAKKIFIFDMDRTTKSGIVPTVLTFDNFIVCFSTSPNKKAYNGVGRNSLFMEQLLKYIIMTNTSFQEIFRLTRDACIKVSKNMQIPTIYDNVQYNMYLNCKIDQ